MPKKLVFKYDIADTTTFLYCMLDLFMRYRVTSTTCINVFSVITKIADTHGPSYTRENSDFDLDTRFREFEAHQLTIDEFHGIIAEKLNAKFYMIYALDSCRELSDGDQTTLQQAQDFIEHVLTNGYEYVYVSDTSFKPLPETLRVMQAQSQVLDASKSSRGYTR